MRAKFGYLVTMACILFVYGSAWALPTLSTGVNSIDMFGYESLYNVAGAPNSVDVNDIFYGFAEVSNIKNFDGEKVWEAATGDRLYAYFLLQVANVADDAENPNNKIFTLSASNYDPLGIFDVTANDQVIKFVTSTNNNFTPNNVANLTNIINSGSLWMSFDLDVAEDSFWFSSAPQVIPTSPSGTNYGQTWFGLNVLDKAAYLPSLEYYDPLETGGTTLVQFAGQGTLANSGYVLPFQIDPEAKVFATPEPSTMILFGVGLLGLGAVARRRR